MELPGYDFANLPCEQQGRTAGPPAVIFERRPAARGVDCDRAEKFAQLLCTVGVKRTIGAARQVSDLAKGFLCLRIAAFVKDEHRYAEQAKLACLVAKRVDVFLHAVADEHDRIDLLALGLGDGKSQDLLDLCLAAAAGDGGHVLQERCGAVEPGAGFALAKATVEHELDVEAAERRSLPEHLALDVAGLVPGRLPACGRIEGEHQPAALARCRPGRRRRRQPPEEGIHLRAGRRLSGQLVSVTCHCRRSVRPLALGVGPTRRRLRSPDGGRSGQQRRATQSPHIAGRAAVAATLLIVRSILRAAQHPLYIGEKGSGL